MRKFSTEPADQGADGPDMESKVAKKEGIERNALMSETADKTGKA